ncbi:MAG: hypothetical protein Q8755_02760, partial [Candidatus Phytoplasma australasiaticum]|nr:hypothetical protein [Candidatus Phytoplasma australasiaticum]
VQPQEFADLILFIFDIKNNDRTFYGYRLTFTLWSQSPISSFDPSMNNLGFGQFNRKLNI